MPYLTDWDKYQAENDEAVTPGMLNYLFTVQAIRYVEDRGLSYQTINDVLGALEGAKLEFYRRVVAPYEDKKIKEKGDVY
jgi:hypothetical protein